MYITPKPREDPVTLERIPPELMYTINKQTYDVRSLAQAMLANRKARIPHSRRTPTRYEIKKIYSRLPNSVLKNAFDEVMVSPLQHTEPMFFPGRHMTKRSTTGQHILNELRWSFDDRVEDAATPEQLSTRVRRVRPGDALVVIPAMAYNRYGVPVFPSVRHHRNHPLVRTATTIYETTVRGVLKAAQKYVRKTGQRGLRIASGRGVLRYVEPETLGLDPARYPRVWKLSARLA